MSVLKVVADRLLTQAEAGALGSDLETLRTETSVLGARREVGVLDGGGIDAADFTLAPIVPNGPLTIQIIHVYTGGHPKGGLFSSSHADMIVTSALKNYAAFAPASRAINFLAHDVGRGAHLVRPKATEQGTPIVAYYPAVLTDSLTLTIEMAFDSFDANFTAGLGQAFSGLAGIPVFLPYAGYLLAAGSLVRLVGNTIDNLVDGRPKLAETLVLNFNPANGPTTPAEIYVMCADDLPRDRYRFNWAKGIVEADSGKAYDGDEPYVLLLVDGAPREELKEFGPTAASSAMVERFLAGKPGSEVSIGAFVDAVKLYNDFHYRQQADKFHKQLSDPGTTDAARAALERRYRAALANIHEEALRPK